MLGASEPEKGWRGQRVNSDSTACAIAQANALQRTTAEGRKWPSFKLHYSATKHAIARSRFIQCFKLRYSVTKCAIAHSRNHKFCQTFVLHYGVTQCAIACHRFLMSHQTMGVAL